jgi:hypothetical protein
MKYEAVYLYTNTNQFVGVAIKKVGAPKLESVNIWSDSEEEVADFKRTLAGLNDEGRLRQFWPDAMDPEVVELVEDPEWEPLELHEETVIDWENSTVVAVKQPVWGYEFNPNIGAQIGVDEHGQPVFEGGAAPAKNPQTGEVEWQDTDEIDRDASTFVQKKAMVPDPQEAQDRYFKAQEIVARRRADLALASDSPA